MSNVKGVIFDLDGTLLDTGRISHVRMINGPATALLIPACFVESFVLEAVKDVVEAHGKTLTSEAVQVSTGRRPLEAWQSVKEVLDIDCTAEQLFEESEPILTER